MYYKFLNGKEIKTNQKLLYSTFVFLSPGASLGVPAHGVCMRAHVSVHMCVCACACLGCKWDAPGETHCCSAHHTHSVSLELCQADLLSLAILLIEATVPTPEMHGQSCQQGTAPCTSQPDAGQL